MDLDESRVLVNWLRGECDRHEWKYVELRPLFADVRYGTPSRSYCLHELDLSPSLEHVFNALHKDSIQRSVRRAEREQLCYESGRSETLLDEFYRLVLITRRRHCLLPQPRSWFENLLRYTEEEVQIRVARKNGNAIAAMLTLRHQLCVTYKCGASDEKFHRLGGMPFLFWRLIEESKNLGLQRLDLGRSDLHNQGLITFKDRFGADKRLLTYYQLPKPVTEKPMRIMESHAMRQFISVLPDAVLCAAGNVLYRHVG